MRLSPLTLCMACDAETAYPKWNSVNQVLAPGGDGTNQEDPTGAHPRLEEWRVMHANPAECAVFKQPLQAALSRSCAFATCAGAYQPK